MSSATLKTALESAPVRPRPEKARAERELFCFEVGGIEVAFDAGNVREVLRASPCTRLPRAPTFVLGVVAHRGEVLPLVDLLRFLARGEARPNERSRFVVAFCGGQVSAFVADAIVGIQRVPIDAIHPVPLGAEAGAAHLGGVVQPDGAARKEPLHVVEVPGLLEAIRARVVTR